MYANARVTLAEILLLRCRYLANSRNSSCVEKLLVMAGLRSSGESPPLLHGVRLTIGSDGGVTRDTTGDATRDTPGSDRGVTRDSSEAQDEQCEHTQGKYSIFRYMKMKNEGILNGSLAKCPCEIMFSDDINIAETIVKILVQLKNPTIVKNFFSALPGLLNFGVGAAATSNKDNHLLTRQVTDEDNHLLTRQVTDEDNHLLTRQVTDEDNHLLNRQVTAEDNHLLTHQVTAEDNHQLPRQVTDKDSHQLTRQVTDNDNHQLTRQVTDKDNHQLRFQECAFNERNRTLIYCKIKWS